MATYAIYTYEFEQIKRFADNQLEIEGFPATYCTDEEWEHRLETFRTFFKKGVPLSERTFENGRSKYVYDTIFIESDIAIMKVGRLSTKNVADAQLNDHKIEDYPWCYVIWDNRDGIQRMLIEQKQSAWKNTKTSTGTRKVAKALKTIIDSWLNKKGMNFNFGDGPVYKSTVFWDYLKLYPQGFTRVHFSFPPPNLGRLFTLGDNLNELRTETGGGVDADLKSPDGGALYLVPENPQTKSLVDLSSACGSEIRAYPKGGYAMIRISGNNSENDVVIVIPDELLPILSSLSLFSKDDYKKFISILNSVKNLY